MVGLCVRAAADLHKYNKKKNSRVQKNDDQAAANEQPADIQNRLTRERARREGTHICLYRNYFIIPLLLNYSQTLYQMRKMAFLMH